MSERSGALEPVTLDLTGERVAEALAEPRSVGTRARDYVLEPAALARAVQQD